MKCNFSISDYKVFKIALACEITCMLEMLKTSWNSFLKKKEFEKDFNLKKNIKISFIRNFPNIYFIHIPMSHLAPYDPLAQPFKQLPFTWLHGSLFSQFPQICWHSSPNVLLVHSIKRVHFVYNTFVYYQFIYNLTKVTLYSRAFFFI